MATRKVLANWLEKEAELQSDLYAVRGTAVSEKKCFKLFFRGARYTVTASNINQLRFYSVLVST